MLIRSNFAWLLSAVSSYSANADISEELSQALSKWRALTAYLYPSLPANTAYSAQIDEQI